MIRYFNSFVITSILYIIVIGGFFYTYSSQQITLKKKVEIKRVSLKHIELIKKVEPKPLIVKKKIVKQVPEVKKPIEKIAKKIKKVVKNKRKPKKVIEKKKINEEEPKVVKEVIKKEPIVSLETIAKNTSPVKISPLEYKKNFLKKNLLLIKKHIQSNVKYSRRARKMNIQGNVLVQFSLSKNGIITNIKALSGHRLLRKSTIKAIYKAATLFPKVSRSITIKIPIAYKLI